MRLTLRTLLAYLDNALDPQETELLRTKLSESGFATQLVQRIRQTLADGSISAPSAEAVGPVEEANVISEYLDSTMPKEQVAEVERACLESDPHLAEAAACHQILTMVLRKPADVPPELRARIYELPDRAIEEIASGESFSAVNIPVEPASADPLGGGLPHADLDPLADGLPTADLTLANGVEPVEPVGVADSGVSDAPTRIRQADSDAENMDEPAIAGATRRDARSAAMESAYYGRSIRPSRIAPWLVSFALVAVLLFVLTRIFQPLLEPPTSSGTTTVAQADVDSSVDATEPTDESSEVAESAPETGQAGVSTDVVVTDTIEVVETESVEIVDGGVTMKDAENESSSPAEVADADSTQQTETDTASPGERVAIEPPLLADLPNSDEPAVVASPGSASPPVPPTSTDLADDRAKPQVPADTNTADQAADEVAKFTSERALAAAWDGDQWVRLKKEMMIAAGMEVVVAPTFRGQFYAAGADVTVIGPAHLRWLADDQRVTLRIDSGQVLASATAPDTVLDFQLGDQSIQLKLRDADSVAAVSVQHFRAPGFDPLKQENRVPLIRVLSVQGTFEVAAGGSEQTLQTGQQWTKRGSDEARVSPVEAVPEWIDPPDPADSSLEAGAREELLELLKVDQSLEIALREATLFRHAEVAALAAQTLLSLGQGDVYFGGDGMLSQLKQRLFWPDHFRMLLATVNRSAASAQQLRDSMAAMDSANAKALFRLLTGYSQKQLAEGGDEELVQMLASNSMAVRVLALENLRLITGSTANFRPEKENEGITKWLTRQRRGDIRWQE